jgi:methyl-accepting chemotaxis protein
MHLTLPWSSKVNERLDEVQRLLDEANYTSETYRVRLDAIGRSMAIIEFDVNGTICSANENFLATVGYSLDEIVGKHHRMFLRAEDARSTDYTTFWPRLRSGEFFSGEFLRINKRGEQVWIQATYNPVFDENGQVKSVVKFASDVTEQKRERASLTSRLEAVSRCFAVIEFEVDGTIIRANDNFLDTMGYSLSEIQGKHHSMFAEASWRNSPEYVEFWRSLGRGEHHSGEYKRIGKGGREIYIQASYNPVFGLNGEITSVIKFATNVTEAVVNRQTTTSVAHSVA